MVSWQWEKTLNCDSKVAEIKETGSYNKYLNIETHNLKLGILCQELEHTHSALDYLSKGLKIFKVLVVNKQLHIIKQLKLVPKS